MAGLDPALKHRATQISPLQGGFPFSSKSTTVWRKLRRLVVRVRCLVASCDGSLYVYDVPSQVATARRTCTMSRRKLRRPVVRVRRPVAGQCLDSDPDATTMIYKHVLNRDGRGVKSLVDLLGLAVYWWTRNRWL